MKTTLHIAIVLAALWFVVAQRAGAQDVVRFQEQNDELQGQISIVEPQNNLLIAERNSIPYSFRVTSSTRITVSNQQAKLENLTARKGQSVTVRFRVTRNGNIAREVVVP